MLLQWWTRRARPGPAGVLSPTMRRLARLLICPVMRLAHRPRVCGLERLPRDGPYLLVGNHSGAMAISELLALACLWISRMGQRPLAGMGHPFGFVVWPVRFFIRRLGAIPASVEHALSALARGIPLLVFPGGAQEASRPFWRAGEVDLCGHTGFLRIAHQARAPIVPLRIHGSHLSCPVLWQSRRLLAILLVVPRLLGVKQYPVTLPGVAVSAALALWLPPLLGLPLTALAIWAFLASPFPFLPVLPVSIRYQVGEPIPPGELFDDLERPPDAAALGVALRRVQGRLQGMAWPGDGQRS